MNVVDIVIAVPLLWGVWQGFNKGLILTVASIAALLLGIWGAIKFSTFMAVFLRESLNLNFQYNSIIAFAITFVLIVVAVHLSARLLDKLLSAVAMGLVVKIMGALLGLLKWGLIVSVLLSIYGVINTNYRYTSKETIDQSVLYKPVAAIAPYVYSYLDFTWLNTDTR